MILTVRVNRIDSIQILDGTRQMSKNYLFSGILPPIPPPDYEEPDTAVDYIDPQKRELLDFDDQETITLKNVCCKQGCNF